jgi:hypothetical protein
MADLKPLGSEKLNGDDKLKRILELTYYNEKNKKINSNKPELVKETIKGFKYGIVKEKDGYYVKSGLNESSLDYIGGMFMKNKNRFSSYGDALKRLELLKGQQDLQEATKYVLKQTKPQQESPMSEPPMDAPLPSPEEMPNDTSMDTTEPSPEGDTATPSDLPPSDDTSGDSMSKKSDYMSEVQKYAGKLGQELRDLHEKMESDDIKYVLNMIISAVDLDKLDDEDIEDIGKKFERDLESGTDGDETPSDETPAETPAEEPSGEEDLGETMSKLDDFINTPIETDEIDLSKYADLSEDDDLHELDLDEIKNDISNAIGETLSKYFKH